MDKSGAGSFIYAKASGIIRKSFVGPRAQYLFEQKSLSDLWTLLFHTPVPLMPEALLAEEIEKQAFKRFVSTYAYFVGLYSNPSSILTDQLLIYEAENLKEIGAALCSGETKCPSLIEIGKLQSLHVECWPEIQKITKDTTFSWYNHIPAVHEQQKMEYKIDLQVLRQLWKSLNKLTGENREVLYELFKEEYIISNIIWALRLKVHYQYKSEQIIPNLMYVTDDMGIDDPIAAPAIKIIDYPVDEYEAWENWHYKDLLNPHTPGEIWNVDPGWIERMSRMKFSKNALHIFHQHPMTEASLIGWFKVKSTELSYIRTAVESIRLCINANEAMDALGIYTGAR
ncbi:MAG: V-type ATPase subunit [Treponema sp.]|nr:V-type ATPase subunit [Treponema sp.]MDY5124442.1 V-type ATPase subunit [Treponema sp.]